MLTNRAPKPVKDHFPEDHKRMGSGAQTSCVFLATSSATLAYKRQTPCHRRLDEADIRDPRKDTNLLSHRFYLVT